MTDTRMDGKGLPGYFVVYNEEHSKTFDHNSSTHYY